MAAEVTYRPAALDDLDSIYRWIAEHADPGTAFGYVRRLQEACESLRQFPGRGSDRADIQPGLRSLAFERNASIVYRVKEGNVQIIRVLRRGRDLGEALA